MITNVIRNNFQAHPFHFVSRSSATYLGTTNLAFFTRLFLTVGNVLCINFTSPPKPHAFASLPLQSKIFTLKSTFKHFTLVNFLVGLIVSTIVVLVKYLFFGGFVDPVDLNSGFILAFIALVTRLGIKGYVELLVEQLDLANRIKYFLPVKKAIGLDNDVNTCKMEGPPSSNNASSGAPGSDSNRSSSDYDDSHSDVRQEYIENLRFFFKQVCPAVQKALEENPRDHLKQEHIDMLMMVTTENFTHVNQEPETLALVERIKKGSLFEKQLLREAFNLAKENMELDNDQLSYLNKKRERTFKKYSVDTQDHVNKNRKT